MWADKTDIVDVRNNFHVTLSYLRRVLEPNKAPGDASHVIMTTEQGYQILPCITVAIDTDKFMASVRTGQEAVVRGNVDKARSDFGVAEHLCTGDFALAKADLAERLLYQRTLCDALRWLATDNLEQDEHATCIARVQRLLQYDAWDADASALLICAFIARGDRRAARRQYQRFLKTHGAPTPQIRQLACMHGL